MRRGRPFIFLTAFVLAGVATLIVGCNCPPRPEPTTSGGGNTYSSREEPAAPGPLRRAFVP